MERGRERGKRLFESLSSQTSQLRDAAARTRMAKRGIEDCAGWQMLNITWPSSIMSKRLENLVVETKC